MRIARTVLNGTTTRPVVHVRALVAVYQRHVSSESFSVSNGSIASYPAVCHTVKTGVALRGTGHKRIQSYTIQGSTWATAGSREAGLRSPPTAVRRVPLAVTERNSRRSFSCSRQFEGLKNAESITIAYDHSKSHLSGRKKPSELANSQTSAHHGKRSKLRLNKQRIRGPLKGHHTGLPSRRAKEVSSPNVSKRRVKAIELNAKGKPEAATLSQAQNILGASGNSSPRLQKSGQPYSLPEARKFTQKTKTRLRHLYDRMSYEEIPAATWYADEAVRPLLLTFDAFGTLFTPRKSIESQYCEVARQFSMSLRQDDVKNSFAKAYKAQLEMHPNYGKATGLDPSRWWTEVIKQTIIPLLPEEQGVPHRLPQELYKRFSSKEGYQLYPDVFDLLTIIGTSFQSTHWPPRRTMLGIVSNSDPRVYSILESFGIEIYPSLFPPRYTPESIAQRPNFGPAHFAFASLSYVHGVAKPSTELYEWALRDAQRALDGLADVARFTRSGNQLLDNIDADFHHMHIGDDWEKDIVPAMKQGFDAVLIDRSEESEISYRDLDGEKVTVINSLTAISKLLTVERLKKRSDRTPKRPVPLQVRSERNTYGRSLKPHPAFPDGDIMTLL